MGRNNPRLKPAFPCKGCDVTLQHNKETTETPIFRGSELIAILVEIKIKCRNPECGKETIISGEIPAE